MVTVTVKQERGKQVALAEDVWQRLKVAAAQQKTSMREVAERAILKELDGKPRK